MNGIKEKIVLIIDNIKSKFKINKSLKYYVFTVAFVLIYAFFFTSNIIFYNKGVITSTSLYENQELENISVFLIGKQYNPKEKKVYLMFKTKYRTEKINRVIDLSVKDKNDYSQKMKAKIIRVNSDYTVAIINVPDKWGTLLLSIYEREKDNEKEGISGSSLRMYVDSRDIKIDTNLLERDKSTYLVEATESEINHEELNIINLNNNIKNNQETIDNTNEQIEKINDDMKYQTESEIEESKALINSKKSIISSTKNKIDDLNKQKDESNKKIEMLKKKMEDIPKNEQ